MKYILLLAILSFDIFSMEQLAVSQKRKLECEFLKAARDGNIKTIKEMLAAGVNPQAADVYGRNALHLASWNIYSWLNTDSYEILIDLLPANLTQQQDSLNGNAPLHCFIERLLVDSSHIGVGSSHFYEPIIKKLIVPTCPQVLTTANYLGKIPFDYLDDPKINFIFRKLKTLLKPPTLSQFTPQAPRLLSSPFTEHIEMRTLLEVSTDRKVLGAVLHQLQIDCLRSCDKTVINTRKNVGRRVLKFISAWDLMSKRLASGGLLEPQIAHTITFYYQFNFKFTEREKDAFRAMFLNNTVIPNKRADKI